MTPDETSGVILRQVPKDLKELKDSSEHLRMSGMRTCAQNDTLYD